MEHPVSIDFRISGNEDDVLEILAFLSCVQHCAKKTDSPEIIKLKVNTDSEEKISILLKNEETDEWVHAPEIELEHGEEFDFFVGEG